MKCPGCDRVIRGFLCLYCLESKERECEPLLPAEFGGPPPSLSHAEICKAVKDAFDTSGMIAVKHRYLKFSELEENIVRKIDQLKIAAVDCFAKPTKNTEWDESELLESIRDIIRNPERPVTVILHKVPGKALLVYCAFEDK